MCLLKTSERNISAHMRDHIERVLASNVYGPYQVDHEYNRMGCSGQPKNIPSLDRGRNVNVVPDIAVHLRGQSKDQNPDANFLVVEVKNIPRFEGSLHSIRIKRSRKALCNDLRKLERFRDPLGRFGYKHTAAIVFSCKKVWIALDCKLFEPLMDLAHR